MKRDKNNYWKLLCDECMDDMGWQEKYNDFPDVSGDLETFCSECMEKDQK